MKKKKEKTVKSKKKRNRDNKRERDQFRKQKELEFQTQIKTYSNSIKIPQLNELELLPTLNTLGFETKISGNHNIISNNLNLSNDNLIKGAKLDDILNKTFQIKLFPTVEQKNILLNWMDAYIDIYNKVLEKIKNKRREVSEQKNKVLKYNEIDLKLSIASLKKEFVDFKEQLSKKTNINKHILDYAINDAITMFKSSVTNLNRKRIKKSRLRYLKKSKSNKIIKVEKILWKSDGFCTSILGQSLKSEPVINYEKVIDKVAIIKYDCKYDCFTLFIRKELKQNQHSIKTQKIISLDPGLRTFMTGVSNEHVVEYAPNLKKKIMTCLKKIDGIKSNKDVKNKKRCLHKYEKYLENYINDVHWQIVNDLTSNYNHIFLGNFSTKDMVEYKKMDKKNKRLANAVKMFQFRQKLKYKCLIKGCKFKLIHEHKTSMICSNCGNENKGLGKSKIYNCNKCNKIYDRDINAAKNILLKGINLPEPVVVG